MIPSTEYLVLFTLVWQFQNLVAVAQLDEDFEHPGEIIFPDVPRVLENSRFVNRDDLARIGVPFFPGIPGITSATKAWRGVSSLGGEPARPSIRRTPASLDPTGVYRRRLPQDQRLDGSYNGLDESNEPSVRRTPQQNGGNGPASLDPTGIYRREVLQKQRSEGSYNGLYGSNEPPVRRTPPQNGIDVPAALNPTGVYRRALNQDERAEESWGMNQQTLREIKYAMEQTTQELSALVSSNVLPELQERILIFATRVVRIVLAEEASSDNIQRGDEDQTLTWGNSGTDTNPVVGVRRQLWPGNNYNSNSNANVFGRRGKSELNENSNTSRVQ